jgi:hypothetical protein
MNREHDHIARCLDLQENDIAEAVGDRACTKALLLRLEAVSAPNTGVAKVLLVFARLGTTVCDWLDGDLTVDLSREGEGTRIDVSTELGGGLRERVFSPLLFKAPLVEFARAIERVPHMVAPLVVRGSSASRVVLSVTAAIRRTSIPPPPVEISAESLFAPVVLPAAPEVQASPPDLSPLPVVTPAAPRPASEVPVADLDSGWDD